MNSPPDFVAVQTGVYYAPNIQFCAFDIAAIANYNPASRTYLDYNQTLHLCNQVGIFCASPLFIGKYDAAITYNPEFESTIPALLSLTDVKLKSQLLQLFVADALETFQQEYGKFFQTLPPSSQQTLLDRLQIKAEKLVAKYD
jgi:hypothetical protein